MVPAEEGLTGVSEVSYATEALSSRVFHTVGGLQNPLKVLECAQGAMIGLIGLLPTNRMVYAERIKVRNRETCSKMTIAWAS